MRLVCEIPEKLLKILRKYKDVDPFYNKYKNDSPSHECRLSL
jgi:hypothetical protein